MRLDKQRKDRLDAERQKQINDFDASISTQNVHNRSKGTISNSTMKQRPSTGMNNPNNLTLSQERGLVNRLSQASPKRFKLATLEASDKYRKYQFKPQICKKSVHLVKNQVEQGKWQNVNDVYDHLSRDVYEREAKKQERMTEIKQK